MKGKGGGVEAKIDELVFKKYSVCTNLSAKGTYTLFNFLEYCLSFY